MEGGDSITDREGVMDFWKNIKKIDKNLIESHRMKVGLKSLDLMESWEESKGGPQFVRESPSKPERDVMAPVSSMAAPAPTATTVPFSVQAPSGGDDETKGEGLDEIKTERMSRLE